MKSKVFVSIFLVWVAVWLLFLIRDTFIPDHKHPSAFSDYKILLSRSTEGKRSYLSDDRFYEFLAFCKEKLPPGASFKLAILNENFCWSIYKRRAIYYLYPHLEEDNAGFILVYDEYDVPKTGYGIFARLDNKRYILKKNEA